MWKALTLCLLSCLMTHVAYAESAETVEQETTYKRYSGWYWKEKIPEESDKKKEDEEFKDLPPLPSESELMSSHPKKIRKMYEEYTEQAVWKPTIQNVTNHIILKDVIRRKSKAFSAVSSLAIQMQPQYNAAKDYPSNTVGRNDYVQARNNEILEFLRSKSKDYSFVLLAKKDKRSSSQSAIVENLVGKINWEYRIVDIDQNPVIAEKMGVTYTPTLMLISRKKQDYMPVVSGIETQDRIMANTYRSIRYKEGDITPEQFFTMEYEIDSSLDPMGHLNDVESTGINQ